MPERQTISRHQLKIWSLLILYQMCHHAPADGYPKIWMLRFLLAFIHSYTDNGDRKPFDAFWKAATGPKNESNADGTNSYTRGMMMHSAANAICKAVGEEPKAIQDHFWDEMTRDAYAKEGKKLLLKK